MTRTTRASLWRRATPVDRGLDVEKARLERAFSLRLDHLSNGQRPTGWK
jgi:hypothetical protein